MPVIFQLMLWGIIFLKNYASSNNEIECHRHRNRQITLQARHKNFLTTENADLMPLTCPTILWSFLMQNICLNSRAWMTRIILVRYLRLIVIRRQKPDGKRIKFMRVFLKNDPVWKTVFSWEHRNLYMQNLRQQNR